MMPRIALVTAALSALLFALAGCSERRATEAECRKIFDRIIDIELSERGFRDPALAERKRDELARRYHAEIQACTAQALPSNAMDCIARARTTEELSHVCLR